MKITLNKLFKSNLFLGLVIIYKNLNFQIKNKISIAEIGTGIIVKGINVPEILKAENIYEEALAEVEPWYNGLIHPESICYFISNWSGEEGNQWITIQFSEKEAALFNPMNEKISKAKIQMKSKNKTNVHLQLKP